MSLAERASGARRAMAMGGIVAVVCGACVGQQAGTGTTTHESAADADTKPSVYTVNYPLQYFAERIGGGEVDTFMPVPAALDPAYWEPDAISIAAYQSADLILLNGAGYARWIATATLPASKMVDTSAAAAGRLLTVEDAVTHSHGPEGAHSHGELAFTTWLDPQLAIAQAGAIYDALRERLPQHTAAMTSAYEALVVDLEALDASLRRATAGHQGTPIVASHPVYQYLAARYSLDVESLHWEPGEPPTERQWQAFETRLAERPAAVMLWEAEPLPRTRQRLGRLGVGIAVYRPCSNIPGQGDWLAVMRRNVIALAAALGSQIDA